MHLGASYKVYRLHMHFYMLFVSCPLLTPTPSPVGRPIITICLDCEH